MPSTTHLNAVTTDQSSTVQTVNSALTVYASGDFGEGVIQVKMSAVGAADPKVIATISGDGAYIYPPMFGDLNFELVNASDNTEITIIVEN